jgi:predicted nuclease of predicted toxin-antitoxin system
VIRVLLDQGLAPNTAVLLRSEGWDAIHVGEAGMSQAADEEILRFARQHNRTCVTLDHDFHTHLALNRHHGPSVVLIRAEGLDSVQQADLIRRVWSICAEDIDTGAAVSVDRHAVRIRRLPLK